VKTIFPFCQTIKSGEERKVISLSKGINGGSCVLLLFIVSLGWTAQTVLGFVNEKHIISFCGAEVWIRLCSNGSELYNLTEGLRCWLAHVPEWGWAGLAHFQYKLKTLCHPTLFLAPAVRLDTSAAETFVVLFFFFPSRFSPSFFSSDF